MEDLAPRQRQVMDAIATHLDQWGIPPTLRELGDALGIKSTNGVADHIKALIRKGYLERGQGKSVRARSLRMTSKATGSFHNEATVSIPLVGQVAAGSPVLAQENYDGSMRVDSNLVPQGAVVFGLKVRGDSMIEDGILDGDIVFVRQQETARNGETVVALVDDDATVKRFYRERGRIRLEPANREMASILVHPDQQVSVLGKVIGLYRSVV
jgi:repressor LexA